jgi:predicted transcriptional regulator
MEDVRTIRDVMMPVQDVINQDESVLMARRRLQSEARQSLIVVDRDMPVGVLEWRQIMNDGGDLDTAPVSSVMSRSLPELTQDMTIEQASRQMGNVDVSTLPVVDDTGHLVGEVARSAINQADAVVASAPGLTTSADEATPVDTRFAALRPGMTVSGSSGSKIGDISDLVTGTTGQLNAIMVSHGLFGRKHKRVTADLIGDVTQDEVTLLIDSPEFKALPDVEAVEETA